MCLPGAATTATARGRSTVSAVDTTCRGGGRAIASPIQATSLIQQSALCIEPSAVPNPFFFGDLMPDVIKYIRQRAGALCLSSRRSSQCSQAPAGAGQPAPPRGQAFIIESENLRIEACLGRAGVGCPDIGNEIFELAITELGSTHPKRDLLDLHGMSRGYSTCSGVGKSGAARAGLASWVLTTRPVPVAMAWWRA